MSKEVHTISPDAGAQRARLDAICAAKNKDKYSRIKEALAEFATHGQLGDNALYVVFDTDHPGVKIQDCLRSKYPGHMTIIIKYQFWDLSVEQDGFHITLSFERARCHLHIPFSAIIGFRCNEGPIQGFWGGPQVSDPRFEAVLRAASSAKEARRYEEALAHIHPSLPELRDDPAQWEILAEFLLIGGVCLFELGKLAEAEEYFREGVRLHAENSDGGSSSNFIYELSLVALERGDIINSRKLVQEAIDSYLDNAVVVARTGFVRYPPYNLIPAGPMLCQLALLDQKAGDCPSAIQSLELARAIAERSCSVGMLGVILNELGLAQIAATQFGRGMKSLVESVRIKLRGDGHGVATTLANIQQCINLSPEFRADSELPGHLETLQRLLDR